jgi:hypothetical protein
MATNRTIEHLSLDIVACIGIDDIFRILTPFVEHNHNLRSIEFKKMFPSRLTETSGFISALAHATTIGLENISLISVDVGDHVAVDLCYALNSTPGFGSSYKSKFTVEQNRTGGMQGIE